MEFDGVPHILERGIRADVALVKAWKADPEGNLVYRYTAQNFNPGAAMSGRITIAEVEVLVKTGELDPNHIHTPGIFVQRLVHNPNAERKIEKTVTRKV
jgi:3-oxoacid CoA-transferase subunit A